MCRARFLNVPPLSPVFHAALLVMAALQVHETHTALVRNESANWTVDYIVSACIRIAPIPLLHASFVQNGGGPGTLWQNVSYKMSRSQTPFEEPALKDPIPNVMYKIRVHDGPCYPSAQR